LHHAFEASGLRLGSSFTARKKKQSARNRAPQPGPGFSVQAIGSSDQASKPQTEENRSALRSLAALVTPSQASAVIPA